MFEPIAPFGRTRLDDITIRSSEKKFSGLFHLPSSENSRQTATRLAFADSSNRILFLWRAKRPRKNAGRFDKIFRRGRAADCFYSWKRGGDGRARFFWRKREGGENFRKTRRSALRRFQWAAEILNESIVGLITRVFAGFRKRLASSIKARRHNRAGSRAGVPHLLCRIRTISPTTRRCERLGVARVISRDDYTAKMLQSTYAKFLQMLVIKPKAFEASVVMSWRGRHTNGLRRDWGSFAKIVNFKGN